MKQSFIFKAFFFLLLLVCSSNQMIFAQNSTTKSQSSKTIEIDISKSQKLSLQDNDDRFNMNLRFEKEYTTKVREMLTKELGNNNLSTGRKQIWTSKNRAYTFELKQGHLYVNIIKNQLEAKEYNTLKNLGNATLDLAGFQVDVDGSDGNFNIHID